MTVYDIYDNLCKIVGCEGVRAGRGLCNKHYLKFQRGTLRNVEFRDIDPLTRRAEPGERQRWLEDTFLKETDECIPWPFRSVVGGGDNKQYGLIGEGKTAHRWICEKENGPCPAGEEARHTCGFGLCCNKRHLKWATHRVNELDKITHGTHARHPTNGRFMRVKGI